MCGGSLSPHVIHVHLPWHPYDLNVLNNFLLKVQWKKEKKAWTCYKIKQLNNNPKMKYLKFLTFKSKMHSLEKIHELILYYII
jgi:hypothetical protein